MDSTAANKILAKLIDDRLGHDSPTSDAVEKFLRIRRKSVFPAQGEFRLLSGEVVHDFLPGLSVSKPSSMTYAPLEKGSVTPRSIRPQPLQQDVVARLFKLEAKIQALEVRGRRMTEQLVRHASAIEAAAELASKPDVSLERPVDLLWQFSQLEQDWDSYGANPITAAAVAAATRLLVGTAARHGKELGEQSVPWSIAPFSGGVQLEWRASGDAREVDVNSQGQYGYLLEEIRDGETHYQEADEVTFDEALDLVSTLLRS